MKLQTIIHSHSNEFENESLAWLCISFYSTTSAITASRSKHDVRLVWSTIVPSSFATGRPTPIARNAEMFDPFEICRFQSFHRFINLSSLESLAIAIISYKHHYVIICCCVRTRAKSNVSLFTSHDKSYAVYQSLETFLNMYNFPSFTILHGAKFI